MLSDFLVPDNVIFNLESTERDECLAELLEVLVRQNPDIKRDMALNALYEREEKMSTAVLPFIAVPHAICKTIDSPILVMGISRKGIPFESIDENSNIENKVNIVFEILFDEKDTQRHLHLLRDILKVIVNPDFYQSVMNAKSIYEILDFINAVES